jgi:hypothetical protein
MGLVGLSDAGDPGPGRRQPWAGRVGPSRGTSDACCKGLLKPASLVLALGEPLRVLFSKSPELSRYSSVED